LIMRPSSPDQKIHPSVLGIIDGVHSEKFR
jgi:hypothetical protein